MAAIEHAEVRLLSPLLSSDVGSNLQQDFRGLFERFDRNGDGMIDREEYARILSSLERSKVAQVLWG